MKHLKALAEIIVVITVCTAIIIAVVSVTRAVGIPVYERDDVKLCMEEIVPQYEWKKYTYTATQATYECQDKTKDVSYYVIVVYAGENEVLHRYEWFCRVRPDDVDCDLVRDDICEDY